MFWGRYVASREKWNEKKNMRIIISRWISAAKSKNIIIIALLLRNRGANAHIDTTKELLKSRLQPATGIDSRFCATVWVELVNRCARPKRRRVIIQFYIQFSILMMVNVFHADIYVAQGINTSTWCFEDISRSLLLVFEWKTAYFTLSFSGRFEDVLLFWFSSLLRCGESAAVRNITWMREKMLSVICFRSLSRRPSQNTCSKTTILYSTRQQQRQSIVDIAKSQITFFSFPSIFSYEWNFLGRQSLIYFA